MNKDKLKELREKLEVAKTIEDVLFVDKKYNNIKSDIKALKNTSDVLEKVASEARESYISNVINNYECLSPEIEAKLSELARLKFSDIK